MTRPTSRREPVVLLVQRVDDDRAMYEEFLVHQGLPMLCANDAAEALQLAPMADIVVTGLMLPGAMDGFEFIQRLRSDERTKHIPIVVVTAWAWQTERLRAQDAGCDVFLTKPCLPDELLREIRSVLADRKLRAVGSNVVKPPGSRPRKARHRG